MRKFFLSFLLVIFAITVLPVSAQETDKPENLDYAVGRVLKVISKGQNQQLKNTLGGNQTTEIVDVKILSGEYKGKIFETENQLTSNPVYDIKIKKGDRVVLDIEKGDKASSGPKVYIADVERMPALLIITGLFFCLILAIGGIKGLRSLFSLGITALLVFFALVPGILAGLPIIPLTIGIVLVSTLTTMFVVVGFNLKSVSACIGTIGGLAIAGLMSALMIKIAPLSGLTDQEAVILFTSRPDLNLTGIMASAMIIGALGAIMDVGISIASSVEELKKANPLLAPMELTKCGMNIGMDIMGAMSNTLILAYIGGAFPLILLAANVPLVKFINLNSIASEITSALVGSIGIVLCVPITALVSGYLIGKNVKSE